MKTASPQRFRKLGVVGSGTMGSGIAQKMASEGFTVVMLDLDDARVEAGMERIRRTLDEGVQRKVFAPEQAQAILNRIEGTTDWSHLGDADLVVEAVFEDREVKRQVFERLDAICRPDAILATNTSSLSVSALAAATRRPERILGLHFFYHPAKNRLVEVVPGERTSPAVRAAAWALQEQLGKTPIASADRPGFVVNRFFVPWLNEAVRLLQERVADIPTIEAAARQTFGVGMGPFELMNLTGVPIALHAAATLGRELGPFYAPAARLGQQVETGEPWPLEGAADQERFDTVAARLLAVVFYVACALVEEGVGTLEDTDIGARVGLRWPKGPFELMNAHGLARARELVESLASRWNLELPGLLREQARRDRPFTFRYVRTRVEEGIATLTLARPDAMNALNATVVAQLHEALREALEDSRVQGVVLAGTGKAFVAGADIRFFLEKIEQRDFEAIVAFTRAGHELLGTLAGSAKPVVARVHGLALGGGLELALACHAIAATPRAALAFPETGLGIYPGLGGTQRTPRRIGVGLAKWLIFTGAMLGGEEAAAIGLVDATVPHEELDATIRAWIREGLPARRAVQLSERHRKLEAFFARHRVEDLLQGRADTGGDADLERALRQVKQKAPRALELAERLIEAAATVDLEAGLAQELASLVEIFSTRDAYEGLRSVGRGRPVFEGR